MGIIVYTSIGLRNVCLGDRSRVEPKTVAADWTEAQSEDRVRVYEISVIESRDYHIVCIRQDCIPPHSKPKNTSHLSHQNPRSPTTTDQQPQPKSDKV